MYKSLMTISILFFFIACTHQLSDASPEETNTNMENVVVESVAISGSENNYTFNVRLKSPDTGCDQYANWWEVIDLEEGLIYRRILGHSHVSEQPFTRSGGPVSISSSQEVYIRGHMNNLGYGTKVMFGSVANGFDEVDLPISFGADLINVKPLPGDCPF